MSISNFSAVSSNSHVPEVDDKRPIVISGPSGSGKSTLLEKLLQEFPTTFGFSVSHTTRAPRPGEANGVAYHFVTKEYMEKAIADSQFIEHASFSKNLYGTSRQAIEDVAHEGKICILDIEMQGVKQVKQTDLDPRYIFIRPASLAILEARLRGRGTETEQAVQNRLDAALADWDQGTKSGYFDKVVVNDDIEHAYNDLKSFIFQKKNKPDSDSNS